jgi:hypothetical protein
MISKIITWFTCFDSQQCISKNQIDEYIQRLDDSEWTIEIHTEALQMLLKEIKALRKDRD